MSYKINQLHIPVNRSTFKNGQDRRVHRWFRLTPSYGPDLVHTLLNQLEIKKSEHILDPFSGASTTIIESALTGFSAFGFEINPFLHWVGKTSINWDLDLTTLLKDITKIQKRFSKEDSKITCDNLVENNLKLPKIHNPFRWWNPDILTQILILKRAIEEESEYPDFFLLALAGVLVPDLTNVTLGRLQLHFVEKSSDSIEVLGSFLLHAELMLSDLDRIQRLPPYGKASIFHTDSTAPEVQLENTPISCVVTSPPYPNRYSYVWNTRPHLYLFDFFSNPKEAAELDKATIGGTWGSATSCLTKGVVEPEFEFFQSSICPVVEEIRAKDNLMANYVMKYFNLIAKQVKALDSLPQKDLRCAYVVGNSRIKEVYVETDVLLADIFTSLGYDVSSIDRFRKRNSGTDLFESTVFAWK